MTLGVSGTGPYGKIRDLRNEINQYKYEIRLIEYGLKRPSGKAELEKDIADCKRAIKKILHQQKRRKK